MAQKPRVYRFATFKNTAWTAIARVRGNNGNLILQADFDDIACRVATVIAGVVTETFSQDLTVTAVVFDTLQNDDRWTVDATGYNFLHQIPASAFANLGHHQIDYTFKPTGQEEFALSFKGPVRSKG